MNFIKNCWLIVAFFCMNNAWAQQMDNQIEIIVYRPKTFSQIFVRTRLFVNDSLVAIVRNGKYKQLFLNNSQQVIKLKYSGRNESKIELIDLNKLNPQSNRVFLRVCWEQRFLKLHMSLVPVYGYYAIEEIKQLEPM